MGSNADRFKMTQGKDSVWIRSAALLARFTIALAAAKSQKRTRSVLLLRPPYLSNLFVLRSA